MYFTHLYVVERVGMLELNRCLMILLEYDGLIRWQLIHSVELSDSCFFTGKSNANRKQLFR